jgi:hypothetical protein
MAGCVLRVSGSHLIAPPELGAEKTRYGLIADVGHEDSEFKAQLREAEQFLTQHKAALFTLTTAPGFETAELDFGVWNKAPEIMAQSHSFPAELVALAGQCGVGLTVSMYLASAPQPTVQGPTSPPSAGPRP